jgi:rfaE bifunctional protein nucleotidyltransferase chain/domain
MTGLTPAEMVTYKRKIKTREELREIIGRRPRAKKVIMCHGTFDLVHPGHIRHLIYAKSKADILVTSLTTDQHIAKANFRPFVPEALRAMNLAALEIVDYVVIDENPTPIENIAFIQPDYFAKGYEYNKDGVHPKTREEMDTLEAYGGEVIFTPGDIVYSSSRIIESEPPNLASDKLHALMEAEGLTFDGLRQTLLGFKGVKVHVIGDTIVDSYTYCTLIGGNTKTPTFSLKYERQVDFVGGAGIVAKHLKMAGADVKFTTVLGDDQLKDYVLKDLKDYGIDCDAIIDRTRPTTQKNLFTAGGYRMLKVDKVDNRPVSDRTLAQFSKRPATLRWSYSATFATGFSMRGPSLPSPRRSPRGRCGSPTARWPADGEISWNSRGSTSSRQMRGRRGFRWATRTRPSDRWRWSFTGRLTANF